MNIKQTKKGKELRQSVGQSKVHSLFINTLHHTFLVMMLFIIGTSLPSALAAQPIYVSYQKGGCLDQLMYQNADNTAPVATQFFFDYHLSVNATERVVFRTRPFSELSQSQYDNNLSNSILNCSNLNAASFKSLVGQVADGQKEIYFVEADQGKYKVHKAMQITYQIHGKDYFYVHNADYTFRYNYQGGYNPSEKLSYDEATGAMTLFAGATKWKCMERFGVMVMPAHACSTETSIEYLKGVGTYIEKNTTGFFVLKKVNSAPANQYLANQCNGDRPSLVASRPPSVSGMPTAYSRLGGQNTAKGGSPTAANKTIGKSNVELVASFIPPKTSTPTANTKGASIPKSYDNANATNGIYTVKDDDTLYSLSKRFNTTVEQLMEWNNLQDSTIKIDQQLFVKAPAAPVQPTKPSTNKNKTSAPL